MSMAIRPLSKALGRRIGTTQAISDEIRDAIVQGKLAPGTALRQDHLAKHFEVSHIPIREALKRLESEGWVSSVLHKGAVVSGLDADEAREIYEMRAVLECFALKHAIPAHTNATLRVARGALLAALRERDASQYMRRNEEFHLALLAPAGRKHLQSEIEHLHQRSERYLRQKYLQPALKHESDREHQELLEAVELRNLRKATAILSKHLFATAELLAQHIDDLHRAQALARPQRAARRPK